MDLGKGISSDFSFSWILGFFEFLCENWTNIVVVVEMFAEIGTLVPWGDVFALRA